MSSFHKNGIHGEWKREIFKQLKSILEKRGRYTELGEKNTYFRECYASLRVKYLFQRTVVVGPISGILGIWFSEA